MRVSARYIYLINRQRNFERRKGENPSFKIMDYYTEIRELLNIFLILSQSLLIPGKQFKIISGLVAIQSLEIWWRYGFRTKWKIIFESLIKEK